MPAFTFHSLALALAALMAPLAWAARDGRPNIVVIVADDWGFSDVGAFGGEIATPNLDALARRGVRFSNFHVAAECSPTRAMLMTGVDSHRTGVGAMRETVPREHYGRPGYLTVLNQNVVTMSSLLQDGGYRTYAVGKWHVGKEPHNLPDKRGFDRSLVQGDSGSDNWETAKRYVALTDKVYWFEDGKEAVMPKEFYSSEYYVNRAIDYLRRDEKSDKPFYTYLAFQANHLPVQAPREFIDKYRGRYNAGWTALVASTGGPMVRELERVGATHITLPLLAPYIVVALIIRTIDALKAFDTIYVITQGGPGTASETINIFLYLQAFAFYNVGYASAVVVVFFVVVAVFAPWIAPFDQATPDYDALLEGPSWKHLAGTDTIAGSTATMDRLFRFAMNHSELPLDEALLLAVHQSSVNPARALGLPSPLLEPGNSADLVVLDDDLTVRAVLYRGEWV